MLDTATPAASHEPDGHPVTATSAPVRRPLTVEHEPSKVASEATTVANEPATESVPAVRAPSQADAPPRRGSLRTIHPSSVQRPSSASRRTRSGARPSARGSRFAAGAGGGRGSRALDERAAESCETLRRTRALPRSCAVTPRAPATPVSNRRWMCRLRSRRGPHTSKRRRPRTPDFAANIPTTIVTGSAVATAGVGAAPVLFSPTVVGAPPAASNPLSRPRERVKERADLASGGAHRWADPLTLTHSPAGTTESIPGSGHAVRGPVPRANSAAEGARAARAARFD